MCSCLIGSISWVSHGATLLVDPTGMEGSFASINAAIQSAVDGDIIEVKPGRYEESLIIDRQITISGSGVGVTTVLSTLSDAVVLTIDKPFTIQNMTIRGGRGGIAAPASDAMRLRNSANTDRRFVSVRNCVITDCGRAGILFETPGTISVENSIVKNCGQSGILLDAMSREDINPAGGGNITNPTRLPTDLNVSNCLIAYHGKSGIAIRRSNGGSASVTNSILIGNGEFAINNTIIRESKISGATPFPTDDTAEFEPIRLNYSCVWDNSSGIHPAGTAQPNNVVGQGVLQQDPLLDDDYTLSAGSPCRNAGDPSTFSNDPDGSRNDMGAFGGLGSANWRTRDAGENVPLVLPSVTIRIVDPLGTDGAFTSINEAIRSATDGDLIEVRPGRYEESLVIDRRVTIQGSGVGITTLTSMAGDAIALTTNKPVSIHNLLIRSGGNGIAAHTTVETTLRDSREDDLRYVTIKNCVITDCGGAGIFFEMPGSILVTNSIIKNCGLSGVLVDAMSPEDINLAGGGNIAYPRRFPTDIGITNSMIVNNRLSGIAIERANGGGTAVVNSIVAGNGDYAINNRIVREIKNSGVNNTLFPPEDTAEFETGWIVFSCVWNNQIGIRPEGSNDPNLVAGRGVIEADPQLADDLTAPAGSPCQDAGDPAPSANDPDGTRNDIGALGGPGSVDWKSLDASENAPLALATQTTRIVDPLGTNGAFTSINAAIQSASDGDLIDVMPGRYEETLVIDRQVTIQGSGVGSTTLSSVSGDAIVLVTNKPLSIRNMLIRSGGNGIAAHVTLETRLRDSTVQDHRFVSIKNCVITDCGGAGIFFETPGSIFLANSIIKNCGRSGVLIDAMSREDINLAGGGNIVYPRRFPTHLSISNSLIADNAVSGVEIRRSNRGGAIVANSILTGNGDYAVNNTIIRMLKHSGIGSTLFPPNDTAEFEEGWIIDSCVWNNRLGIFPPGTDENNKVVGPDVLETDPMVEDDLTLSDESPCLDAGDFVPSANDPDGSRNDIGPFGGPGALDWRSREVDADAPLTAPAGTVRVVDPLGANGAFTTISAAILASSDGDLIEVRPGRYDELLTIDRQVTIHGSGVEVTMLSSLFGDAITITTHKPLTIRNMLIRASGHGIIAPVSTETRLRDSTLEDRRFVNVKNCIITDCGGAGIFFETPGSIALVNSVIRNCVRSGILVDAMSREDINVAGGGNIRYPIRFPTDVSISNSVLDNNSGSGVSIERSNQGGTSIVNTVIINNQEYAVNNTIVRELKNAASGTLFPPDDTAEFERVWINHSCLWNNRLGIQPDGENETNVVVGRGLIESDPMLDNNSTLLTLSPCIDRGDSAPSAKDPNGTRNDVGAFGGPGAIDWEGFVLTPPPTPTPTPIPPTPTPTPIQFNPAVVQAAYKNTFNQPTSDANGLIIVPPGAPGEYELAAVEFGVQSLTSIHDNELADGIGMTISLNQREGALIFFPPQTTEDDLVLIRASIRASHPEATLAIGLLDAVPSDNIAGAMLNGTLGSNIVLDSSRFVNEFRRLEAVAPSERGAVVPLIQVTNTRNIQMTVEIDNLQLFRISNDAQPRWISIFDPAGAGGNPFSVEAIYTNGFNETTTEANRLISVPPGTLGEYELASINFEPLSLNMETDNEASDGFGLSVVVDQGDGALIFFPILPTGDDLVLVRANIRTSHPDPILAIGLLDAVPANDIAGARLNGTLGSNILLDATRFVNRFSRIRLMVPAERGAVVPLIQVTNTSNNRITVEIDNMEVFRVSPDALPQLVVE